MATIRLYESFDMTARTDLDGFRWGPGEGYITYSDGYRIDVVSNAYDRLDGVSLSQHGDTIVTLSNFRIATSERLEAHVTHEGNLLPVWQQIMTRADTILGSAQADRVNGFSGNDVMKGNGGSDHLLGGGGADTISGGIGADRLFGDLDHDTLRGGADADILWGGSGSDQLHGGTGNDRLLGGVGADTLHGNQGADVLIGQGGNDLLVGGLGADVFVFGAGSGRDRIRDFADGQDLIRMTGPFDDFTDIRVSASGDNTVLNFGKNSVTLVGVDAGLIDADDFHFV